MIMVRFFGTHDHFVAGLVEIVHGHHPLVVAGGEQRAFVDQVGQFGTGKTGGAARQVFDVDVVGQGNLVGMDLENLFAALDVGQTDLHLTVETARP
jgi:hypothetical protein